MKTVIQILEKQKTYLKNKTFRIDKDLQKIAEIDQALQLLQTDVSKCVYCDNKPYKKGAAYCERHMASDDYS